jgi:multiple antibiotic resistance protein
MAQGVNTFLLVLAAIFPVVNPPGTALVFLALTQGAAPELRRELAWRVAKNALMSLSARCSAGLLFCSSMGFQYLSFA